MADETATTDADDATSDAADETQDDATADLGDAGKKALAAERTRAKTAEAKAKALEAELEEIKRSQMTDQEKAIAEARAAARSEALAEAASAVAAAEFRAAAAGRLDDDQVETLLAGLDVAAFTTEGQVDKTKISEFMSKFAPEAQSRSVDRGQGSRATGTALNGDPLLSELKSKLGIG